MAARYVRIGQYPDYRDEIRGTLLEILASTANPGTYAAPEDVAGCTLEMGADGLWTGNMGTLTQVQEDALVASGVMGKVKKGAKATVGTTEYSWTGSTLTEVGISSVISVGIGKNERIVISGDSNVVGYGANTGTSGLQNAREKSWPILIARALGWQTGSFFGEGNCGSVSSLQLEYYDNRIVNGSFLYDTVPAFGGRFLKCTGPSVSDFSFTPEQTFDEYSFYFPKTNAAQTSISILLDGIVVDTFSQMSANSAYGKKTYQCSLGLHTISIRANSTGNSYIHGIETRNTSSKAPVLLIGGWCSANMANMADKSSPWSNLLVIPVLAPTIVMLHCLINDFHVGGLTITGIADSLNTFTNAVVACGAKIIHSGPFPFQNAKAFDGTLESAVLYVRRSALACGGGFADARDIFGPSWESANSLGLAYPGTAHPNGPGYAKEAELFAKIFV